ncbi:roadblock/LC7 domain-containing protein [Nocardia higoensis]|uniref:roadblock/LC7 domain-containing protein n=1 Tax=Nocardia higoensis TaxID=228599 RepID=UPI0002F2FD7D|nr:roadblock/LC7 domain-containing protein [Nocardia higoensis]
MTARRSLLGDWMGRLTKVAMSGPEPYAVVLAELQGLRERVPRLTGALVASGDGLLITHDLPGHIEPDGMAALTASHLALSHRVSSTAHGGGFDEVVVRGSNGYVVIYAAGWASMTVLAESEVNVGRLHLESRPVARAIADHLTALSNGPRHTQSAKVE